MTAVPGGITFSFGENWTRYVERALDADRLRAAEASLLSYLPGRAYEGAVFIDVGCGSGIFSLGALRLGCARVVSVDVDPRSVAAARMVRERLGSNDPRWEIVDGDILDDILVERLRASGDIVYSWGVLHHTGNMYRAIEQAMRLVRPGGHLILAIYNRAPSSPFWLRVKRFYNAAPRAVQAALVYVCIAGLLAGRAAGRRAGRRPPGPARGMSVLYDMVDWLGGYPYEYATFGEIQRFVEARGFALVASPRRLPSAQPRWLNRFSFRHTGNNEFVFRRVGAA